MRAKRCFGTEIPVHTNFQVHPLRPFHQGLLPASSYSVGYLNVSGMNLMCTEPQLLFWLPVGPLWVLVLAVVGLDKPGKRSVSISRELERPCGDDLSGIPRDQEGSGVERERVRGVACCPLGGVKGHSHRY